MFHKCELRGSLNQNILLNIDIAASLAPKLVFNSWLADLKAASGNQNRQTASKHILPMNQASPETTFIKCLYCDVFKHKQD